MVGGVMLAADGSAPVTYVVFPEGEPKRLESSRSNGNTLVPSDSECREMLLIKAVSLQVCAC